jgi:hypothetical protein
MATAKKRRKPAAKTALKTAKKKAAPAKAKRAPKAKPPIVRGVHAMLYSSQAVELRTFLRDKLGFKGFDVGDGWLIFNVPEADLGVHPTEGDPASGTAHISFYCEDIAASIRELKSRGVEISQEIQDQGWGLVAQLEVPGGFEVQLYQPKYPK